MALLFPFGILGLDSGVEHRLQLRDAVAVFAAGQHHLLAAVGAAEGLELFQRFGQLGQVFGILAA